MIIGCSKVGNDPVELTPDLDADRKKMLVHTADQIVKPAYQAFSVKLDAMIASSNAFAANPSTTTLSDFRATWVTAYTEWQKVELFDFGPAAKYAIRNYINIYPTNIVGISKFINDPSQSLEVTGTYDKQGFPALDYLLNGVGDTDEEIVAYYKVPTEGAKRLVYIARINDHIKSLTSKVVSEWNGTYYQTFTTKTGVDIGSPMGEMINGYILHFERFIRSGKVGIPSGSMLNGIVASDKVEAFYKKDISKVLAQTALQGVADFFNGKSLSNGNNGASLKSYLDGIDAKDSSTGTKLSENINNQFKVSQDKLQQMDNNFVNQITTNNTAMQEAYKAMQLSVRMLKVDMTSAMSITITYTDNDGD